MAELVNQESNSFRAHHGPSGIFEFVSAYFLDGDRKRIIAGFLKTQDWMACQQASYMRSRLHGYFKQDVIKKFFDINRRNDDYSKDAYGEVPKDRIAKIVQLAQIRIVDMDTLLFGDCHMEVVVGSLLDAECKACAIGSHCRKVIKGGDEDSFLANQIKKSCDVLGFACRLEDSPDGICELDGQGNKIRCKVAILNLGTLRDFILRRLIYSDEMQDVFGERVRELQTKLNIDPNNIQVHEELNDIKANRMAMVLGCLAFIDVPVAEEIRLQERIDDARKLHS